MKVEKLNKRFLEKLPTKLNNDELNWEIEKFVWRYHGNVIATLYKRKLKIEWGWQTLSVSTSKRLNNFHQLGFSVYRKNQTPYICLHIDSSIYELKNLRLIPFPQNGYEFDL